MNLITFPINWIGSMAWHLSRVATGRPYYRGLADSGFTVASFLLMFTASLYLRWGIAGGESITEVISTWLSAMLAILILGCRRSISDSLMCALMASSTVVDLLAAAMVGLGLLDHPSGFPFLAIEFALYLRCIQMFYLEDPQVRRAGYRRRTGAEADQGK